MLPWFVSSRLVARLSDADVGFYLKPLILWRLSAYFLGSPGKSLIVPVGWKFQALKLKHCNLPASLKRDFSWWCRWDQDTFGSERP